MVGSGQDRTRESRGAGGGTGRAEEDGGEAVGILFHEKAFVSLKGDASLLFASISRWPRGDTSFAFLGDAWRRWPEHRFVLVTDGDGDIPHVLERDRQRTAGILIAAGDANPEVLGALCGKVVESAAGSPGSRPCSTTERWCASTAASEGSSVGWRRRRSRRWRRRGR